MKRSLGLILWGGIFMACQSGQTSFTVDVDPARIRAHVRFLADDLLEGRSPGTRGGELAARYLATQFELAGLEPANQGSYYQMVPLVGITAEPSMVLRISAPSRQLSLEYLKDFVAWAGVEQEEVSLDNRPLVFAGYGITAPEVPWDDFEGVEVRDKVLLVLVNDPPSEDPNFFGGPALTYYGRWTYKLEEAARRGAAGILLIHNTEMAGYPWGVVEGSWTGEQFGLPQSEPKTTLVEGWIQQERADQLLRLAGLSFEEARALAARPDFRALPLNLRVSIQIRSRIRRIESPNVVARLPGSHPQRREEAILITTHYDHIGVGPEVEGDRIYNGAFDNASGTGALLELARVMAAATPAPPRSILFAAVTAEEQGLLGSEYYARHPLVPLAKTVANINVDGVNPWGETEDLVAMGAERSTLQQVVEQVAREMGMSLSPDPSPEKGYFFRSDQFSLVKVGVPAVYYDFGLRFKGKPASWGRELMDTYTARHYHQPSDEFDPEWTFEGAAQLMRVVGKTALRLAHQETFPEWNPGDPFAAIREASLQKGN